MKNTRRASLRRLSAYVGILLAVLGLAAALFVAAFGGAILDHYVKGKVERAFAAAHPGSVLRIGELDYSARAGHLGARSVSLSTADTTLKADLISLTGVRWVRLLRGGDALADALARASLEVTNLDLEIPRSHYGIRCARLRAAVADSELIAEEAELRTLVGDDDLFAEHPFRMTRFKVVVPECRVSGLGYGELLRRKSYRARSVHLSRPFFDVLVDRDKPVVMSGERPLMVHEALATIRRPLQVDSLIIADGSVRYCERLRAGADPGVLTFAAVGLSAEGITNRADATAAILLQIQGKLMNAGVLRVRLTIPVAPPDFSLHYSGSLSAMDVTRLNAFLDIAEKTRIKSGSVQQIAFDVDVAAGKARGRVRATYRDLKIAVLDKRTGSEKGLDNRVASFLANLLKIRNANAADKSGALREGKVDYTKAPGDEFVQFLWFSLRSGVLDAINF